MPDLQTKWMIDTCHSIGEIFTTKFDLPLVLSKNRNTCKTISELNNCMQDCIDSNKYDDYIYMIFRDYENYFGTKVLIPEPSGTAKKICQIMKESYRLDLDLLNLYYKGVNLVTLDSISIQIVGNHSNLAELNDLAWSDYF